MNPAILSHPAEVRTRGAALETMLCATDLSSASDHAVAHALALGAALGARLTLYHAVEMIDHRYAHWNFDDAAGAWRRAEKDAEADLLAIAHAHPKVDVAVERVTSVPLSLVETVMRARPDLLVMGTHGRRGLRHLLLGSVAEEVVRAVNVPVLCVRQGTRVPYRRIVVPTDLSPASARAFPLAGLLARTFGAEVIALHVAPVPSAAAAVGMPVAPAVTEAAVWQTVKPVLHDVVVTPHVATGRVWERITHLAEVEDAHLIVMSTRGHDSVADTMLGSTTERVLRHAHCPVLVA